MRLAKHLCLNVILCCLFISGTMGTGYCIDSGTGTASTTSNILRHYFPDTDAKEAAENINVLVLSNSGEDTAAADLEANTTGINFTSMNIATYDPVPSDFEGYDAVLLFENVMFDNTVDVGNAVYDYQQSGGGVILATFVWQDWSNNTKYSTVGWGDLESVSPLISDTQGCEYNADNMESILVPDHPVMAGVNSLYAATHRGGTQLSTAGTALALWSTPNYLGTDDPVVAVYEPGTGGRTVAISVFPDYAQYGTFGTNFSGDFYQLFENALNWAAKKMNWNFCFSPSAWPNERAEFDLVSGRLQGQWYIGGEYVSLTGRYYSGVGKVVFSVGYSTGSLRYWEWSISSMTAETWYVLPSGSIGPIETTNMSPCGTAGDVEPADCASDEAPGACIP